VDSVRRPSLEGVATRKMRRNRTSVEPASALSPPSKRAHYCEPADDTVLKSSPGQPAATPSAGLTVRRSESGDADDWLTKAEHRTAAAIWQDHLDWYMIAPKHPEEQARC
jgi:hypothetical protein